MAAIPIPYLACSHTVRGTATIGWDDGFSTYQASISDVRLWTDLAYGTAAAVSDHVDLLNRLAWAMQSGPSSHTFTSDYDDGGEFIRLPILTDTSGAGFQLLPTHANTNRLGLDILKRLGFSPVRNSPVGGPANSTTGGGMGGVWYPPDPEAGEIDEGQAGFGDLLETRRGYAFTFDVGKPLPRRVVTLESLAAEYVHARSRLRLDGFDKSFESYVWQYLARGEFVRYYADLNSTRSYLTAAVTATASTISVNTTAFANQQAIWVNGERMRVLAGGGTNTLTVDRENPIAHRKYDPVSSDFVATYALDKTVGNINRRGFNPTRVAPEVDRFDLDIGLVRARG